MPDHEHTFRPIHSPYYKRDGGTIVMLGGAASHDQSVSYVTLYCPGCGETKEVIAKDHRKQDAPNA